MDKVQIRTAVLRGLSFSIADLTLIAGWAAAHGLRMEVRLDHGSDTEEFEEILAFHDERAGPCRFILWRDDQGVYLQPLIGRTRGFNSAVAALDTLTPSRTVVLTDVVAPNWPDRGRGVVRGT
jgi:hypothetical protein